MNHFTPTRPYLLTPGPVEVSDRIREVLSQPELFHRGEDFQELYTRMDKKFHQAFGLSDAYRVLYISGSGTLANETVVASLFGEKDHVLVISNGDFATRLITVMNIHERRHTVLDFGWGQPIDVNTVADKLAEGNYTAVAVVGMETSTGMTNPVRALGELCQQQGIPLFVDAVSALGAEDIPLSEGLVDICVSVTNKALESVPGMSFVIVKKSLLEQARESVSARGYYLDLGRYADFAERNQTPTTPAVPVFLGFEVALDDLIEEGLDNRIERYQKNSTILREALGEVGLCHLIPEEHAASAVTTLCLPNDLDPHELRKFLYERNIVVWVPAHKPPVDCNAMQISVMGAVDEEHVQHLLDGLRTFFS